jgi:hypothetical protein
MNKVISYANSKFEKSQQILKLTAYEQGAEVVIDYSPKSLDTDFVNKNIKILANPKGAGLWLWKPYIILKTLMESDYDDKILYCDSGMFPINDLSYLFDLTSAEKDVILFQVHGHKIKDWTHEKCLGVMDCGREFYDLEQVCGAPQLYTKTDSSIDFVQQLLKWCENFEAINDNKNMRHRHDQSILSIFAAQRRIEVFRDPSQYGNEYPRENSKYPQIFNLHRGKNV